MRPSARPSTFLPCPPSGPATVLCARADCPWPLRPYTRLRDCVCPPLHLLAVLATRTRTVPLAVPAGCYVCSTRPSAHPSTFLPCPPSAPATVLCSLADCPWPLRPYARLRDCVRPPLHLLAVLATRTRTVPIAVPAGCYVCSTHPSARPSTFSPCPPSAPATVLCARADYPWPLRQYARLRDCIRPPLHLLAVLATRTRTVPLAVPAGCYVCSSRPSARPSTFSPCPPSAPATVLCARAARAWPLRPHAGLRDCVCPPLHLLAVPVTHTCTVLLAVSAILSTCPLARPSTSPQYPSPALAPFS